MTINSVYSDTLAGYYPRDFVTPEAYARQVNVMLSTAESESDYLACYNGVFCQISIYRRIFLLFIRCFGFTDGANQIRLTSQQLKFFYHGEVNGLLTDQAVKRLKERMYTTPFAHQSLQNLFQEIIKKREERANNQSIPAMRHILEDFHTVNRDQLIPYFWSRLLESHEMFESRIRALPFDDPHLELAQKALSDKNPDRAILQLKFAAAKGGALPFFEKIGVELKHLLARYKDHPSVTRHKLSIHDLFIKVARAFSRNQRYTQESQLDKCREYLGILLDFYPQDRDTELKVAECFLRCRYYNEAHRWLETLRASRPEDAKLHRKIAHAYLDLGDTIKAIELYESAITNYDKDREAYLSALSKTHGKVGKIYLTAQVPDANEKAVYHLTKAWEYFSSEEEYRNQLLQAYVQLLRASPQGFESRFGEGFLTFFKKSNHNEVNTDEAGKILLECIKQCLSSPGNNQEKAMDYFRPFNLSNQFVLAVCDIVISQNAETILSTLEETYLKTRERRSLSTDPELYEKLGLYFCTKDKNCAQQLLEKARQGFESKKQQTQDQTLLQSYDQHLADIRAKLAQNLLEAPPTIKYNDAIHHLQESVRQSPGNQDYRKRLFNALIGAALEEENRCFPFPNQGKIIDYYLQAYHCNAEDGPPNNDPYLSKLFTLYFDKNLTAKAAELFQDIQTRPWVEQLQLSSYYWNRLGQAIQPGNLALKCFKKACEATNEPVDKLFVTDYYNCLCNFISKQHQAILGENPVDKRSKLEELARFLTTNVLPGGFQGLSLIEDTYNNASAAITKSISES